MSTTLQNRLTRKKALLEKAYDLEDKVVSNPRKQYEFDSGDGRVMAKFWTLGEVETLIRNLESSIENIENRLACTNVSVFRMRR